MVFGILLCQTGNFLQHFKLTFFNEIDFLLRGGNSGLTLVEVVLLALESVHFFVEGLFLLLQTAFLLLQIGTAFFDFFFVFGAVFMDFFLGFYQHFAFLVFAALNGFVNDTRCFCFRALNFALGDLFAVGNANEEE